MFIEILSFILLLIIVIIIVILVNNKNNNNILTPLTTTTTPLTTTTTTTPLTTTTTTTTPLIIPIFTFKYNLPILTLSNPISIKHKGTTSILSNPDRGFRYEAYMGDGGFNSDINGDISNINNNYKPLCGMTVTQYYCYLTSYFNQATIPQSLFDTINSNLDKFRQNGIKVLFRFAYETDTSRTKGPSLNNMLSHITQIANSNIIKNNEDVIYCLEAGFLGAWGEWHAVTSGYLEFNYNLNLSTMNSVFSNRTKVLNEILKITNKKVLIRNVMDHINITSDKSRIGFHNDFFMAQNGYVNDSSYSDIAIPGVDRWSGPNISERIVWFDYMTPITKQIPMDGEIGWSNEFCDVNGMNAVKRLSVHHYSTFSHIHNYTENTTCLAIKSWMSIPFSTSDANSLNVPVSNNYFDTNKTIYDYIRDHLGYRIELQSSDFTLSNNKQIKCLIKLINKGFSRMMNDRNVFLILLDNNTNSITKFNTSINAINWYSYSDDNSQYTIDFTINFNSLSGNNYTIGISIESNDGLLFNHIQLANSDIIYDNGINYLCNIKN